jgi:hypothetical protein
MLFVFLFKMKGLTPHFIKNGIRRDCCQSYTARYSDIYSARLRIPLGYRFVGRL